MRAKPTQEINGHLVRFRPGRDVFSSAWRCDRCGEENAVPRNFRHVCLGPRWLQPDLTGEALKADAKGAPA